LPNQERRQFWAHRIRQFGAWQLLSQAVQRLTGFLLVRWMSIEAYAKYGFAFGFQNMLSRDFRDPSSPSSAPASTTAKS
jgi:hypothetical protein